MNKCLIKVEEGKEFWVIIPHTEDEVVKAKGYERQNDYWWFPELGYSIPKVFDNKIDALVELQKKSMEKRDYWEKINLKCTNELMKISNK